MSLRSKPLSVSVLVQFGANISLLRNERLPKGPRFASESLDADTASGPVFQTGPLPWFLN
jgi:hypothetical protein